MGVVVSATHPKELTFEAFIGLLEECEEDSPRHSTETHPEVLPGTFGLEEVQEVIDGGRVPEMVLFPMVDRDRLCTWLDPTS